MSVIVDANIRSAMLSAVRDGVRGGTLEIGTADMRSVLASFQLSYDGGTVSGTEWSLGIVNPTVDAALAGRAEKAQIKDSAGVPRIVGLSVGMSGQDADVVLSNTQVNKGQRVSVDGDQTIELV